MLLPLLSKIIKIINESVFSLKLMQCGLWFIQDLYDDNGHLIPFQVWFERGASLNEFMIWQAIIISKIEIKITYNAKGI